MKKIILILVIIVAVVGAGCNKSKQTLNKIYGDYTLTTYTVNGVDSLNLFKDSLGINFKFYDDEYQERTLMVVYGNCNDGKYRSYEVNWGLHNKSTIIVSAYMGGIAIGTGPFGKNKLPVFEILNLDYDMELKTNYNGMEYVVYLRRKN